MRILAAALVTLSIGLAIPAVAQTTVVECLNAQSVSDSAFIRGLQEIGNALNSAVSGNDVTAIRLHLAISKLVATKCELAATVRVCLNAACGASDWTIADNDLTSAIGQLDSAMTQVNEQILSHESTRNRQVEQLRDALSDRKRAILCQFNAVTFPIPVNQKAEALKLITDLEREAKKISEINGESATCGKATDTVRAHE
jgi:hypothetical protein